MWQERELDVDLLMIFAALGAAVLGVWWGEYYFVVDGAVLIFLVVASPCALMAAIMPTLLSGIARGARDGILFKN